MKIFVPFIFFFLCLFFHGEGQRSVNKFMDQQLKQNHVIAMRLPGWLVRKGGRIGTKYSDDDDAREFLKITQYVKKLRFLVIDEQLTVARSDFDQLIKQVQQEGFEKYLKVRSENDHVHLLVKEEDNIIKNLLVLVYEPASLVMVNMKMKLPVDIFDELKFDPKFNKL